MRMGTGIKIVLQSLKLPSETSDRLKKRINNELKYLRKTTGHFSPRAQATFRQLKYRISAHIFLHIRVGF